MPASSLPYKNSQKQLLKTETTASALEKSGRQDKAQAYVAAATADNTRRTYQSAVRQFVAWGGQLPTTQQQLADYVVDRAQDVSPRTLQLHVTAIRQWHISQSMPTPTEGALVQKLLKGVGRVHARPRVQAKALSFAQIKALCDPLDKESSLKSIRDKALILMGFAGAFRRSELVGICYKHIVMTDEGVVITIPTSKTDQYGEGINKVIPKVDSVYCPVVALNAWLDRSAIRSGALFRPINRWGQLSEKAMTPSAVNTILKQAVEVAGIENRDMISGHSLRRGAATAAAKAGANFQQIKALGAWKSDSTVWQYVEQGTQFDESAASVVFSQPDRPYK